ncbi:sigma-54 dependent transcriptional regulator [Bdellovibrionota bacterium FG-1]
MFSGEMRLALRSDATVLIMGPTGTGKTHLAREIHQGGGRQGQPFVTVNLASLHEGTFESELFGHEKGAFTGAHERRLGRLATAQGGTVFLDEIGELSPRLQSRLLEFLQTRTITPVGGSRAVRLDVRVIVATHRNLWKAVSSGEFREDLFHRLRVISISLQSLAARPDEFDGIMHSCLSQVCAETGRTILKISSEVAERFEGYSWPGNIRELRNVLEYAVLSADGVEITGRDLPAWFGDHPRPVGGMPPEHLPISGDSGQGNRLLAVAEVPMTLDFYATLAGFERDYLVFMLKHFKGRVNETAREVGLHKTTLIRRMRIHGIRPGGRV